MAISTLEAIGTCFGAAGAFLLASNTSWSRYGWIGFGISNFALMGFAYGIQAWGLLLLQVCFCATNALGMWRWLISPALAAKRGNASICDGAGDSSEAPSTSAKSTQTLRRAA